MLFRSHVVSLDPTSLDDVLADVVRVGQATGAEVAAAELVADLRARVETVRAALAGRDPVATMALEWLDPPFTAGHWVPDMVAVAGGVSLLGEPGAPSHRATWTDIVATAPAVLLAIPCGYDLERARREAARLYDVDELRATAAISAERVFAADADGRFSRPGPRVVDGVEALAWVLHPDAVPQPPAGVVAPVGRLA